jgi:hypothetical protein
MNTFTVWGFISEGDRYFDIILNIFAESPPDATKEMLKQYPNLVVSNVCRANTGRLLEY